MTSTTFDPVAYKHSTRDQWQAAAAAWRRWLPVIDGWEATRRLKSNPQTSDIPVIALSAHALAGAREKALAAGCDEFDTKPIEFERLVGTLRRVLARRA